MFENGLSMPGSDGAAACAAVFTDPPIRLPAPPRVLDTALDAPLTTPPTAEDSRYTTTSVETAQAISP